jgi:hypothetical protein
MSMADETDPDYAKWSDDLDAADAADPTSQARRAAYDDARMRREALQRHFDEPVPPQTQSPELQRQSEETFRRMNLPPEPDGSIPPWPKGTPVLDMEAALRKEMSPEYIRNMEKTMAKDKAYGDRLSAALAEVRKNSGK